MQRNSKNTHGPAYRHILFFVQMLFFLTLFLSGYISQSLTQAAYCLVIFTSPLLLLLYGAQYTHQNAFSWDALPFLAELLLALLFVAAMIYGLLSYAPASGLFTQLLAAYAVDVVLSLLFFRSLQTGERNLEVSRKNG